MRPLKIGFVLDDGLDRLDGVQQYVVTLGTWLKQQGHEIHYLVGETRENKLPNIHSLSKNLRVKYNGNELSTPLPASRKKIKKLLRKEKFDVLHVQAPYSPLMAAKVIKLADTSTKIVGTFHILPLGRAQKFAVYLLGLWLKVNSSRFAQMIAVSQPAAELCKSAFNISPVVIPNLVDIKKFTSGDILHPENKIIKIVFLGRLVKRKGCAELIDAVSKIKIDRLAKRPFVVEIGGSGPEIQNIKELIRKYRLNQIVKLKGYINEKNKPGFLGGSDIAVFPSTGGESFGIVLIEAMAARAGVVIGGDNKGYRTVLKDMPCVIFDPSDSNEFAKLLSRLINKSAERKKIHTIQQKIVKQYDTDVVGKQVEEIYYNSARALAK